jgi:hypothetical protein
VVIVFFQIFFSIFGAMSFERNASNKKIHCHFLDLKRKRALAHSLCSAQVKRKLLYNLWTMGLGFRVYLNPIFYDIRAQSHPDPVASDESLGKDETGHASLVGSFLPFGLRI